MTEDTKMEQCLIEGRTIRIGYPADTVVDAIGRPDRVELLESGMIGWFYDKHNIVFSISLAKRLYHDIFLGKSYELQVYAIQMIERIE